MYAYISYIYREIDTYIYDVPPRRAAAGGRGPAILDYNYYMLYYTIILY